MSEAGEENTETNIPTEPATQWGLGDVVAGAIVALFASSILTQTYISQLNLTEEEAKSSLGVVACGMFGLWLGFVGVTALAAYRKGRGSLRDDFGFEFRLPVDLIRGVALGVLGQAIVYLVYLPVLIFSPDTVKKVSDPAKQLIDLGAGWEAIPLGLLVVVGAPIAEELFFRGLTYRAIAKRFSSTAAIWGSAILFGLFHFQGLQLPALIAFGVILALSTRRTGRLGENIIAHMTFNLIPFTFLVLGSLARLGIGHCSSGSVIKNPQIRAQSDDDDSLAKEWQA